MKTGRLAASATLALLLLSACGGYSGERPPDIAPRASAGAEDGNGEAVPELTIPPVSSAGAQPTTQPTSPTKAASQAPTRAPTKAGSAPARGCATKSSISAVGFTAGEKVRRAVQSFRVTLTQGSRTVTVQTPDDPKKRHGFPLVPGVLFTAGGGYTFVMGGVPAVASALPGPWAAAPKATLLIEALAGDGRSIYQQSRTFTFKQTYPNGKACDKKPALTFGTRLTEDDRISKG